MDDYVKYGLIGAAIGGLVTYFGLTAHRKKQEEQQRQYMMQQRGIRTPQRRPQLPSSRQTRQGIPVETEDNVVEIQPGDLTRHMVGNLYEDPSEEGY